MDAPDRSWTDAYSFTDEPDRMVLSLPQAASVLGVSARTMTRLVNQGTEIVPGVEAFKVGSQWRISKVLLERYLTGERVAS